MKNLNTCIVFANLILIFTTIIVSGQVTVSSSGIRSLLNKLIKINKISLKGQKTANLIKYSVKSNTSAVPYFVTHVNHQHFNSTTAQDFKVNLQNLNINSSRSRINLMAYNFIELKQSAPKQEFSSFINTNDSSTMEIPYNAVTQSSLESTRLNKNTHRNYVVNSQNTASTPVPGKLSVATDSIIFELLPTSTAKPVTENLSVATHFSLFNTATVLTSTPVATESNLTPSTIFEPLLATTTTDYLSLSNFTTFESLLASTATLVTENLSVATHPSLSNTATVSTSTSGDKILSAATESNLTSSTIFESLPAAATTTDLDLSDFTFESLLASTATPVTKNLSMATHSSLSNIATSADETFSVATESNLTTSTIFGSLPAATTTSLAEKFPMAAHFSLSNTTTLEPFPVSTSEFVDETLSASTADSDFSDFTTFESLLASTAALVAKNLSNSTLLELFPVSTLSVTTELNLSNFSAFEAPVSPNILVTSLLHVPKSTASESFSTSTETPVTQNFSVETSESPSVSTFTDWTTNFFTENAIPSTTFKAFTTFHPSVFPTVQNSLQLSTQSSKDKTENSRNSTTSESMSTENSSHLFTQNLVTRMKDTYSRPSSTTRAALTLDAQDLVEMSTKSSAKEATNTFPVIKTQPTQNFMTNGITKGSTDEIEPSVSENKTIFKIYEESTPESAIAPNQLMTLNSSIGNFTTTRIKYLPKSQLMFKKPESVDKAVAQNFTKVGVDGYNQLKSFAHVCKPSVTIYLLVLIIQLNLNIARK